MNSDSWKVELINHRCGSYKAWDLLGILNFKITSPTGDCHSKSIDFWRIFIDHKFQGAEWKKIFEQNLYQFVKWGIAVIERLIDMNKLDEEVLIHTTYNHNQLGSHFGEMLMGVILFRHQHRSVKLFTNIPLRSSFTFNTHTWAGLLLISMPPSSNIVYLPLRTVQNEHAWEIR